MPFGATYDAPLVTDDEAFHLAAYINTFERPSKSYKELDFPDKKLKPMSTPYGPWEDNFSAEQHKFGPFPPIREYYLKEFEIEKTK
jgi:thiosulfate dehydrogenase